MVPVPNVVGFSPRSWNRASGKSTAAVSGMEGFSKMRRKDPLGTAYVQNSALTGEHDGQQLSVTGKPANCCRANRTGEGKVSGSDCVSMLCWLPVLCSMPGPWRVPGPCWLSVPWCVPVSRCRSGYRRVFRSCRGLRLRLRAVHRLEEGAVIEGLQQRCRIDRHQHLRTETA